ncbi:deca-heme c-type cytochrome [Shewanella sp. 10N.286.52.C2]|uniref:cytochrome c3 family protein n=1 Tax=Shewanella sp. 10N.286.52.C2 TaxID=1880838 RepID=UPI000C8395D9|nr:cytochrome c3 family protein [Shewanella sp. 10N.286.52.C2]PMG28398.1 deca-heme c-type cytochrome [Shewanella sp. 10N.286.52.C2]
MKFKPLFSISLLSLSTFFSFSILFTSAIAYTAEFSGSQTCVECHQQQYSDWQGSHHDMSMGQATADIVLANFTDQQFDYQGEVSRFFMKGSEYWVNIKGPDGKFNDYKISYTFGYEPLQQYMVEFENGAIQLIPFAWDSRSKDEGGQRWFYLYPEMDPYDEFFWTNKGQNWNYMCADCHSTNVKKNYNVTDNSFDSSWSEINVACEACHGPASEHIKWTKNQTQPLAQYGFNRDLTPKVGAWEFKQGKKILQPNKIKPSAQLATCGQCHSRRSQLTDSNDKAHDHIDNFYDKYILSEIAPNLYYPDGQIYDEVFVLGSFKQSKMHMAGVVCSDCHNPHSNKLTAPIESICFQCHIPSEYSAAKHSQHQQGSEAAQCVSCHMPKTTYMEVDPRADHSFKVPRPDLSITMGTPNVCSQCHSDKLATWAAEAVAKQFPHSTVRQQPNYAEAFYQAATNDPNSGELLTKIALNPLQPTIIRASAFSRMGNSPSQQSYRAMEQAVTDPSAQIRSTAISASAAFEFADRWRLIAPLLTDTAYAIRTEAAGALVTNWENMTSAQQKLLQPALTEYLEIQAYNADRGFSWLNRGNVYLAKRQFDKAEQAYKQAIVIEPILASSYANLADLYRQLGKEQASMAILKQGITNQPKAGSLRYSAGLAYYRQQQLSQAIDYFKQATEVEPNDPQNWMVLGLAQEKVNPVEMMKSLTKAYDVSRDPQRLYTLCEFKIKYRDPSTNACLAKLSTLVPPQVLKQLTGS